ncbi:MAG: FecR family protein, partial [Prevotella sp.]
NYNEESHSARFINFLASKPMRWVATAAAAIVLLVVVRQLSFQSGVNSVQKQFASIETEVPAGSNLHLTLPDGTRVYLNSATKLSYNQGYGIDNREVTLSGEGFFEVAHDVNLPFVVHSDKVTVRDIGTAFRICNYREDNLATVELQEGRVLINDDISLRPDSSLLPGQKMQIDKRSGQRQTITTDNTNTKTVDFNHLDFNDVTLSQIANALSRHYDVKISVADSQRNKRFFGTFNCKQNTIDQVLQLMQATGHIHYKKKTDYYYIY